MGLFKSKTIESVDLLGVTTGFQTGALATYNFPVYSFLIHYTDGSTSTMEIAAENSFKKKQIDQYMQYVRANDSKSKQAFSSAVSINIREKSAIFDDLKKIKDLFDSGVLTEEVYENEKKGLLDELAQADQSVKVAAVPQNNLIIRRNKPRPKGEGKTVIFIDGIEKKEYDLDNQVSILLPPGTHIVRFKRAAVKSKEYSIDITNDSVRNVVFSSNMFSIDVDVS